MRLHHICPFGRSFSPSRSRPKIERLARGLRPIVPKQNTDVKPQCSLFVVFAYWNLSPACVITLLARRHGLPEGGALPGNTRLWSRPKRRDRLGRACLPALRRTGSPASVGAGGLGGHRRRRGRHTGSGAAVASDTSTGGRRGSAVHLPAWHRLPDTEHLPPRPTAHVLRDAPAEAGPWVRWAQGPLPGRAPTILA